MKNMYYVPIFSSIVDSSLWCEPDHVVKVFLTMLAIKGPDHVVAHSAFAIAQRAKKTEAEVLDALKILSSPDTKRLEPQKYDGRRIERVDGNGGGWLILNGEYYQEVMRAANRRAYQRQKQREYRAMKKTGGAGASEMQYVKEFESGEEE